jgi:hypothetical protein
MGAPSEDATKDAQKGFRLILAYYILFICGHTYSWSGLTKTSMRRSDIMSKHMNLKVKRDYCHLHMESQRRKHGKGTGLR